MICKLIIILFFALPLIAGDTVITNDSDQIFIHGDTTVIYRESRDTLNKNEWQLFSTDHRSYKLYRKTIIKLSAEGPESFLRDSVGDCTVSIRREMCGGLLSTDDKIIVTVYKNGVMAYRYTIKAEYGACNLDIDEQYPVVRHIPAHDQIEWKSK